MRYFFILLLFTSCFTSKHLTQAPPQEEAEVMVAPNNKMYVIENGQTKIYGVEEVLEANDVLLNSDTISTLATKEDISDMVEFADTTSKIATKADVNTYIDQFSRTNDTTKITLSTGAILPVRDPITVVNTVAQIGGRFPTGSIIETRGFSSVSDGGAARYQVFAAAPSTVDDTTVIDLTSGNYAVLQPQAGQYDVRWFGAVDGASDNRIPLQKALSYSRGLTIFAPNGNFVFSRTLTAPREYGIRLKGEGAVRKPFTDGTRLKFTGTGNAIQLTGAGSESLLNEVYLSDFSLMGNATAGNGLELSIDGGAILGATIERVNIDSFTNTNSTSLWVDRTYNLTVRDSRFNQSYNGIYLGDESINVNIDGCWITPREGIGIEFDYGGTNIAQNCIIDNSGGTFPGQIGIQFNSGNITIRHILFEDLDKAFDVTATPSSTPVLIDNITLNSTTTDPTITNGTNVKIINSYLTRNIQAGLGTYWSGIKGLSSGKILPPTITGNNPVGLGSYVEVDGSGGAFTLNEVNVNALRDNSIIVLKFLDGNVTVNNDENGNVYFDMNGKIPFKAYTGDELYLLSEFKTDGFYHLSEVARLRKALKVDKTDDYVLVAGESGLTFTSNGSVDTVYFTLPAISISGLEYTFVASDNPIRLTQTGAAERFRGFADNHDLVLATNSTITVRSNTESPNFWDIIAANGLIKRFAGDKGYVGGVSMEQIADSVAVYIGTPVASLPLSLTGNTTVDLNSFNLLFSELGEVHLGGDFGAYSLSSSGTIYSNINYRLANNRGYQIFQQDGTTSIDVLLLDASNDLYLGNTNMNDLYLRAGSFSHQTSGDDVFIQAGNATRMTVKGTGEVFIGSTSDFGAQMLQVTGDEYLNGVKNFVNSTAPGSITDVASVWGRDVTAGQTELFARGETGSAEQITGLTRRLNAQVDATTTTYAGVTDLTFNVEAGKEYVIEGVLFGQYSDGGGKITIAGTATATSYIAVVSGLSRVTALGTSLSEQTVAGEYNPLVFGSILVNGAGTLRIEFAQTDADGGTSSLLVGSYMTLKPVTN